MSSIPKHIKDIKKRLKEIPKERTKLEKQLEKQLAKLKDEEERISAALVTLQEPAKPPKPVKRKPRKKALKSPALDEREAIRIVKELQRFTTDEFIAKTGLSKKAASSMLGALVHRRVEGQPRSVLRILKEGEDRIETRVYEYIDPNELVKPRGRASVTPPRAVKGVKPQVPYTGRPKGPSGRPGRDRQALQKGRRIRRGR